MHTRSKGSVNAVPNNASITAADNDSNNTKMEVYEDLLNWAKDQGIELNGIEPRPLLGRGIGVVATRSIKPNEVLLLIPTQCLRTPLTVSRKVLSKLPKSTSVHGLLAADFLLNETPAKFAAWNAVLPSREDVWASMPLTWDPQLQRHLPRSALTLLRKQDAKFDRDWAVVNVAFGSSGSGKGEMTINRADYLYAWCLVNTRTFYYEATPASKKLHRDDRMALQPVADLLNHSATEGCEVLFRPPGEGKEQDGCVIRARKAYAPGDEVYICYGNHGNDFLLTEYGFVLGGDGKEEEEEKGDGNKWDEVCLDDAVLPELTARQREQLDEVGFLGNYMLDRNGVCHRTEVAVRLMCLPLSEWRRFVDGEEAGDEERQQEEVNRAVVAILRKYQGTIRKTIGKIEYLEDVGQKCQRDMLCLRWRQITRLIDQVIGSLEEV